MAILIVLAVSSSRIVLIVPKADGFRGVVARKSTYPQAVVVMHRAVTEFAQGALEAAPSQESSDDGLQAQYLGTLVDQRGILIPPQERMDRNMRLALVAKGELEAAFPQGVEVTVRAWPEDPHAAEAEKDAAVYAPALSLGLQAGKPRCSRLQEPEIRAQTIPGAEAYLALLRPGDQREFVKETGGAKRFGPRRSSYEAPRIWDTKGLSRGVYELGFYTGESGKKRAPEVGSWYRRAKVWFRFDGGKVGAWTDDWQQARGWLEESRANPPFDGFDLFETEAPESPHADDALDQLRKVWGMEQLRSLEDIIRPTEMPAIVALLSEEHPVWGYFERRTGQGAQVERAWYVRTTAQSDAQAAAHAKKITKALVGLRNLKSHVPDMKGKPLFIVCKVGDSVRIYTETPERASNPPADPPDELDARLVDLAKDAFLSQAYVRVLGTHSGGLEQVVGMTLMGGENVPLRRHPEGAIAMLFLDGAAAVRLGGEPEHLARPGLKIIVPKGILYSVRPVRLPAKFLVAYSGFAPYAVDFVQHRQPKKGRSAACNENPSSRWRKV